MDNIKKINLFVCMLKKTSKCRANTNMDRQGEHSNNTIVFTLRKQAKTKHWRAHATNIYITCNIEHLRPFKYRPNASCVFRLGSLRVYRYFTNDTSRRTLGLRPTDQSCHHETWLHLDFVDWSNIWSKQGDHDRHISLKKSLFIREPKTTY